MPRLLSSTARRAMFAQETGEAFIMLLTLSHPSLPAPIRVCNDGRDVVSGGQTYQQFPFQFTPPADTDNEPPTVRLEICAVDRRIVQAVSLIAGNAMDVSMSIVLASSPDVIEAGPLECVLRNVAVRDSVVSGTLKFEDLLNEPYPAGEFSKAYFPGNF